MRTVLPFKFAVADTFAPVNSVAVLLDASRGATRSASTPGVLADPVVEQPFRHPQEAALRRTVQQHCHRPARANRVSGCPGVHIESQYGLAVSGLFLWFRSGICWGPQPTLSAAMATGGLTRFAVSQL